MQEFESVKEMKRKFSEVKPPLSEKEANRIKAITQGLKKSFKGSKHPEDALEYWEKAIGNIFILERDRRRKIF